MYDKTSLNIHSIEISNYRQYYNKSKIILSRDKNKNFTVIQGSMGSGKTSLLNAISWCLYGTEKQTKKIEGLPIINTRVIKETNPGNFLETEVTIVIGTFDVPLYQITRKIRCFKKHGDLSPVKEEGVFIPKGLEASFSKMFMIWSDTNGWIEHEYFDTAVSQLLPKELSDFFLFDGEELVRFFDEGLSKVKEGIEVVSQISLTNEAMRHLGQMQDRYRGLTRGFDPHADEILKQLTQATEFLKRKESEQTEKDKEKKPIDDRLSEIDEELRNSDKELIREKQKSRDLLGETKKEIYKRIDILKQDRINLVLSWGPQVYLTESLRKSKNIIHKAINDRILPPPIDLDFCKSLLEHGKCICGFNISHGQGKENVQALLKYAKLSPINGIANSGVTLISNMLRSFKDDLEKLNDIHRKINDAEEKLENIHGKLKEIEIQIKNYDEQYIAELETERQAKINLQADLVRELAVINSDVSRAGIRITKLQDQHAEIAEKNKRVAKFNERMKLCKDASSILYDVQHNLINKVRDIVQNKTQRYFLDLIWKKDTFTGLSIDPKYRISVSHIDGFNATGSLSAGETLYLALSFIAALREVTGFKFPIVIDTPLGRVSGRPRILAAENLPKYLPGTQLTLLVTDTEYASPVIDEDTNKEIGSFRDRVRPFVGKEYKLSYDESKRDTDVVGYGK